MSEIYAIVDIETTGGFAASNRITEIAVFFHDGKQIIDHYESLINPEMPIPAYITGLTGIDDQMVSAAPLFSEIAEELYRMLDGKVFVAHNVHFDYSFVKKEFEMSGLLYSARKLCTVRLSRKMIPGLRSYGLGNLADSLGVNINGRHRAAGDAEATAKIFDYLLKRDHNGTVSSFLKKDSKETRLPPNLPKETFESLPNDCGVYYFLDKIGTVIYVGKAIDIKKRISGHFSGHKGTWSNANIRNEIHHIEYELTGNELLALLLENEEIIRLWPKFNTAQKNFESAWGVYSYQDQGGYTRLSVNKVNKSHRPLVSFTSHSETFHFLRQKVEEHGLCPKLSGIQTTPGYCFAHEEGKCDGACGGDVEAGIYNERVEMAISVFEGNDMDLLITGKGRTDDETGFALLVNGKYQGFGYFSNEYEITFREDIENYLKKSKDTRYSRQVIMSFLVKKDYTVYTFRNGHIVSLDHSSLDEN